MDTELEVVRIMIDTDTNVVSRVRKVIDLGDDPLSDYVTVRLALSRAKALLKYRETYTIV